MPSPNQAVRRFAPAAHLALGVATDLRAERVAERSPSS
jgi:hypothetical protein